MATRHGTHLKSVLASYTKAEDVVTYRLDPDTGERVEVGRQRAYTPAELSRARRGYDPHRKIAEQQRH